MFVGVLDELLVTVGRLDCDAEYVEMGESLIVAVTALELEPIALLDMVGPGREAEADPRLREDVAETLVAPVAGLEAVAEAALEADVAAVAGLEAVAEADLEADVAAVAAVAPREAVADILVPGREGAKDLLTALGEALYRANSEVDVAERLPITPAGDEDMAAIRVGDIELDGVGLVPGDAPPADPCE